MVQVNIPCDFNVQGTATFKTVNLPAASVNPANMGSGAPGNYFPASNSRSKIKRVYAIDSAATAVTEQKPMHLVIGATATALSFSAALITACVGTATVTIDLKINGTSILSSPITLTSANASRSVVTTGILSPNLTAGQILEIVITATASTGTLGQGLIVTFVLDEDPQ